MSTRRRLAAGLCVLSVALLCGGFGETVATADTETDSSISDTQGLGDRQGEGVVTTETEPTEVPRSARRRAVTPHPTAGKPMTAGKLTRNPA